MVIDKMCQFLLHFIYMDKIFIFDIIMGGLIILLCLFFITAVFTDIGSGHSNVAGTDKELKAIDVVNGSR